MTELVKRLPAHPQTCEAIALKPDVICGYHCGQLL